MERRLESAVDTIEQMRERLSQTLSPQSMELRIEEAAPGRGEFEDRIDLMSHSLDDLNNAIEDSASALRTVVDDLASRVDSVEASLSDRLDAVASMAGQVIILGSRIDELEESMQARLQQDEAAEARFAELQERDDSTREELDALAPRVDAVDALRFDLEALAAQFTEMRDVSNLDALASRLDALETRAEDTGAALTNAEEATRADKDDLDDRLERLSARIVEIDDASRAQREETVRRVETLESAEGPSDALESIARRITELEPALDELKAVDARVSESDAKILRLEELSARIDALETDTDAKVEGVASQAAAELQAVAQQIAGASESESRADALQAKLDELASQRESNSARIDGIMQELQAVAAKSILNRLQVLESTDHASLSARVEAIEARESALDAFAARLEKLENAPRSVPAQRSATKKKAPAKKNAVKSGAADDLTKVKGIGPKYAKALKAAGVTRIREIAKWSKAEMATMTETLGVSPKKIAEWRDAASSLGV